ncbi:HAD family hydrolase [Roseobacter ponti]|uniref:HAD family phosphatase n=1 Tax=Roseobacter ponti TaxID=1891787 RepID=A0A858SQ64_9RHOB|nr:HAD family phosphatase [Roseobacter ponti]QJF50012.1 HAD family phosphatase [Roseobacter ponti]
MNFPPDMVLFDCDGVLVDSEPLSGAVLVENLSRHGLDLGPDQVTGLFLGGTLAGVMQKAREMGADLPDSWLNDTYQEIFTVLGEQVELIPGVSMVLDRLDAAGVLYAVGSNGPHRKMEISLRRTGLRSRLQGRIYSREDVAKPKPAPDVYLKASADAGVPPARCVVVEDSASGARAGQAAGMYVMGFAADTPAEHLLPHCDRIFTAMSELPELLGI